MRRIACSVAASLLAHLMVIHGVRIELPQRAAEALPLETRLQSAVPLPVVVRPQLQPRLHAAPKPVPAPIVAAPTLTAPPQIAAAPVFEPEPTRYEPAESETPPLTPPPLEASESDPKPPPLPARRLPRRGEIVYELFLGAEKFNIGRTRQAWDISDDSYRLSSVSETTGLAAWFSSQRLAYESRGKLTKDGLRPDHFSTQRVRSGRSESAATDLDWGAMTATIGDPQRSVALPADAQDMVSFMYQLGLMPLAPGRIEMPVTNGWKLERYELEIGVEELLQTPFGPLRAVPVTQVRRAEQESFELWLAPEYGWLPVRIRFFDRAGEPSGEQLVSEIRVSAD